MPRDPVASVHPPLADRGPAGPRPRIVWAEDDADTRESVCGVLHERYDVEAVADGAAALAAVRRAPPDLLLADVMMPGLDGFELLRAVRADPSTCTLPVILVSARTGAESRIEGFESGADDYLLKPFSAAELLARVDAHVELARLRRESAEALRESEALFRTMADQAPVMIWVTDPDGSCIYLNRQWYRFTGTRPEDSIGFGWLDSVHPDDREEAERAFRAPNERREVFRLEYRLRRHDGEYRWAIDAAAPRFGPDGQFLGYIGSVIEITDLKQMEAELREDDRRKNEFLAMLSHELRNPLAPIRNAVQMLQLEGEDPNARRSATEMMERQVGQMVRLVDDLLDVSRIGQGKIEIRKQPVEIGSIVRQAVEATRTLLVGMEHDLTVTLPAKPIYLHADPARLAQAIVNLLSNACKFSDRRGRIWLTVEREEGRVAVRVRDEGIGISAEQLPRVFDVFVQVDTSLDRSVGGLGLGLTLVKKLVELHDGTVEVHSAGLGRGSEFVLRLPISQQKLKPAPVPVASEPTPETRHRVLVVDDNPDAADSLMMLLQRSGHAAQAAYDGAEAFEAAREFEPDVVLLDIGLPKLSGYEVARLLRAQPWGRNLLLIAVTGWGRADDRRRSREAGFDDHLVKPVDVTELTKRIRSLRSATASLAG